MSALPCGTALQKAPSRLEPMAVGAPHFALRDFPLDGTPRRTAADHCREVSLLVSKMVELKDDDVGLATIHTRVGLKVVDGSLAVVGPARRRVSKEPCLLFFPIPLVVLDPIRGETVAAPGLELRLTSPHRRKRIKRLELAAFRARSHARERADFSASDE